MKLLGVFLLAVLGCALAEGAIVAKCDLRNQLLSAVGSLSVTGRHRVLSGIDLVARFACHAEKSAAFNTSAVKQLAPGKEDREHKGEGQPHSWENQYNSTFDPPAPETWTLYGIFQLSSRLACNDSVNPTDNRCGIPCSKLLDDDISDDISCLLSFFTSSAYKASNGNIMQDLFKMLHLIFEPGCRKLKGSDYFAGCPAPPV